jgi:predicted dehydrogenase
MQYNLSRRTFLKTSLLTTAGFWVGTGAALARRVTANEKLNLGIVGTINRARANINGVQGENIVAICDIDDKLLAAARADFPKAKTYPDFRKMLDRRDLDAVVVSTPDHTHAVATMAALKSGRHVYCEKPLAHEVFEVRAVTEEALKRKLATQVGTQIHATDNYRRVVELIEQNAIGPVSEVHVWCGRVYQGQARPVATPPIPKGLHWDLWLGPAPARPYNPIYQPRSWRMWWDFGGGVLGDMGSHYLDLPFWALKLRAPTHVEAEGPPVDSETPPNWLIVRHQFPARGPLPAVKVTWYNGERLPELVKQGKAPKWPAGVLFVGAKGMLAADYQRRRLLPEKDFAGFEPPAPYIPDSIGHHEEWIAACKGGAPAQCNFSYGGPLAETVLLGNVAYRTGQKLEWDTAACRVTNTRDADQFIRRPYRKGWKL